MYTVTMEQECGCFKKSEYSNNNTFKTQQDAYNYAQIVTELMNEEFCSKHTFVSQVADNNHFIIRVAFNTTSVSGCSTGVSCDTGLNSNDDWDKQSSNEGSCSSSAGSCGCS